MLPVWFFFLIMGLLIPMPTYAYTSSGNGYELQMGNITTHMKDTSSLPATKTDQGETSQESSSGNVQAPSSPLTVSLSTDVLDFGPLSPATPVTRSSTLGITSQFPVTVSIFADQPLEAGKNIIPDTSCDNGTCSPRTPALWVNSLTYGFGRSCIDSIPHDCLIKTPDETYASPLPLLSDTENQTPFIETKGTGTRENIQLVYKLNIPATQANGFYSNQVTYLVVPQL